MLGYISPNPSKNLVTHRSCNSDLVDRMVVPVMLVFTVMTIIVTVDGDNGSADAWLC